ncbi:hypothetical protein BGZ49_009172 [Haplosporangium sp. Z 27]|nr:hypothetical protein BGZ49_009172 [Haplosporangium sp. Z 27]
MTDVHRVISKKSSFFFLPHARPAPPTPTSPPSPITPMTTPNVFPTSFQSATVQHTIEKSPASVAHPKREVCLPPTPQHDPSYTLASSAIPLNESNNTSVTNANSAHQSLLMARTMDQFVVLNEMGNGSFGSVFQARHKVTGELVAIKKMKKKFTSQGECRSLQEVKALEVLRSGPNIIRLHHFFLEKKELHMVFELMEGNLYQLIKDQNGLKLEESRIKSMVFQMLRGLQHMHAKGIMHRDMKPENILVTGDIVKIADLGLARELKSRPPYTTYVSTRWYRSPEVLLKSSAYSCAVDLWATGAIAAELIGLKPLFPGNSDLDQVSRISKVLGSPAPRLSFADIEASSNAPSGIGGEWKDGVQMASRIGITFPTMPSRTLKSIISDASEEALELITGVLQYDPKNRQTAYQALHANWFKDMPEVEDLKFLTDVVQQSPDKRRTRDRPH